MFGHLDLETVIDGLKNNLTASSSSQPVSIVENLANEVKPTHIPSDYVLLHCFDVEPSIDLIAKPIPADRSNELRPLSEINIDIEAIRPGAEPPKTIMDDQEGLKIVLHFAKDRPRDDVSVIVITTTNQNSQPISNYIFDVSISKVRYLIHSFLFVLPINVFVCSRANCGYLLLLARHCLELNRSVRPPMT